VHNGLITHGIKRCALIVGPLLGISLLLLYSQAPTVLAHNMGLRTRSRASGGTGGISKLRTVAAM